jgi:SAM-dependent methyltransferase
MSDEVVTGQDGIDIAWAEARATNRANWDDRVPFHEESYGVELFADPAFRSDVIEADLPVLRSVLPGGTLTDLDVCHLQCHIGTDTVSLAREGARITGVDFSAPALASGAALAERVGLGDRITWVESDVLDARAAVTGDFNLVYTSIGTICWLRDLDRWAVQIEALLRPGGTFFIRDAHPFLYGIDENASELVVRNRYFPNGSAVRWEDPSTYAGDGKVEHARTYEFPHSMSEIIGSLLRAGLRLEHIAEDRVLPWQFSPRMVEVPGGWSWPCDDADRVPATFTLVATRETTPRD